MVRTKHGVPNTGKAFTPIQSRLDVVFEDGIRSTDPHLQCSEGDIHVIINSLHRILNLNMRLLLSKSGLVGWADSAARAGDSIALLLGCSVPVILRRRPEGGYHVVGDSIVFGIMEGEVMVESNIGDIELY